MHRFFVLRDPEHTKNPWSVGNELDLDETDAEHIARVLRLKPGQPVVLCDGQSYDYEARLVRVSKSSVRARITSVQPSGTEPGLSLTLVQGIAKGSNMDLIVQKAVEIGVSRIIPVVTERTVVQLHGKRAAARIERWQRIAYEAAKQARRGKVPVVEAIVEWTELWQRDDLGHVVVPWEEEGATGLAEALTEVGGGSGAAAEFEAYADRADPNADLADPEADQADQKVERKGDPRLITVVIGPEGGLTEDEVGLARHRGARPVTLGPRILRTETAAIVAGALVLSAFGEMG